MGRGRMSQNSRNQTVKNVVGRGRLNKSVRDPPVENKLRKGKMRSNSRNPSAQNANGVENKQNTPQRVEKSPKNRRQSENGKKYVND